MGQRKTNFDFMKFDNLLLLHQVNNICNYIKIMFKIQKADQIPTWSFSDLIPKSQTFFQKLDLSTYILRLFCIGNYLS